MATVVRMPSVLAARARRRSPSGWSRPGTPLPSGTPMAEIETEKALVEYAAEEAGIVGRLVLADGETGEIGEPDRGARPRGRDGRRHRRGAGRATACRAGDRRASRRPVPATCCVDAGRGLAGPQARLAGGPRAGSRLRQPAGPQDRPGEGHRPRRDRGDGAERPDRPPRHRAPGATGGRTPAGAAPRPRRRSARAAGAPLRRPARAAPAPCTGTGRRRPAGTRSSRTRRCAGPSPAALPRARRRRRTSTWPPSASSTSCWRCASGSTRPRRRRSRSTTSSSWRPRGRSGTCRRRTSPGATRACIAHGSSTYR